MTARQSPAIKLAAVGAVIAILVVGLWFWSGVVAPGYTSSIVLGVAWFVAASVLLGRLTKGRPGLRLPVRATFVACSLAAAAAFYWTSVRDTVVDEQIVTGTPASRVAGGGATAEDPLAPVEQAPDSRAQAQAQAPEPTANVVAFSGPVRAGTHSASGRARVVDLAAGDRQLTLSDDFEIDPGPEVRVYLATDDGAKDFEDLGGLKGNKGDQQYAIPGDVDVSRYDTVVFWCVPFTQTLGSAKLAPA